MTLDTLSVSPPIPTVSFTFLFILAALIFLLHLSLDLHPNHLQGYGMPGYYVTYTIVELNERKLTNMLDIHMRLHAYYVHHLKLCLINLVLTHDFETKRNSKVKFSHFVYRSIWIITNSTFVMNQWLTKQPKTKNRYFITLFFIALFVVFHQRQSI